MAGRGRREANKARVKDAVMVAALELMDRQGYAATTTTQIATAAGVSPATVFNHFPTKTSILFGDNDRWSPPSLDAPGATLAQTVDRLLNGMLDEPGWTRSIDDPLTNIRFRLVQQEPELRNAQLALAMAQVPAFSAALHHLHPNMPKQQCLLMAGAVIGAVITAATFAPGPDLRATLRAAAQKAVEGFADLENPTPEN